MLDSKIKAKIDEAIKILNDLNDNEKVSTIKRIIKKESKVATWNDIRATGFSVGLRQNGVNLQIPILHE